jgi:hypothetical protein
MKSETALSPVKGGLSFFLKNGNMPGAGEAVFSGRFVVSEAPLAAAG